MYVMIKEYYLAGVRDSIVMQVQKQAEGKLTEEAMRAIIDAKLQQVVNETRQDVYNTLVENIQKL